MTVFLDFLLIYLLVYFFVTTICVVGVLDQFLLAFIVFLLDFLVNLRATFEVVHILLVESGVHHVLALAFLLRRHLVNYLFLLLHECLLLGGDRHLLLPVVLVVGLERREKVVQ